jgi:hypothetical protein
MKKSYHSSAVPTTDAATTLRSSGRLVVAPSALTAC